MDTQNAANAPATQPLDQWFLDLLACPACEQHWPLHLNEKQDMLICACGRHGFPIRDGIPILLVDEAVILDENARPEDVQAKA
ncbi:MAG TPA: Trm112 family protein [Chthonomonadaceae bacterium]|nr:Trm112 family protein [Chthonomonadaceae bacterium]